MEAALASHMTEGLMVTNGRCKEALSMKAICDGAFEAQLIWPADDIPYLQEEPWSVSSSMLIKAVCLDRLTNLRP